MNSSNIECPMAVVSYKETVLDMDLDKDGESVEKAVMNKDLKMDFDDKIASG
jgi:hypothetical protein